MSAPRPAIALLVLDVDGVLTDGRLYYSESGEEIKTFHTRDGYGIRQALAAGITIAAISGRKSAATARRLTELGVEHFELGCKDKLPAIQALQRELGIDESATAVMGDDAPDLDMMQAAGLKIAVADAHVSVKRAADWITSAKGGRGAVREVCDALIAS